MSYRPKVLEVANGGTGLASTTANQILYSSAANTIAGLATANSGVLTTDASGVPSIDTTNFVRQATGMQMKGNNTNTTPPAGFIGEVISNSASSVVMNNGNPTNITSITLTPGIWNINGYLAVVPTGGTGVGQQIWAQITTTSGTIAGTVGIDYNRIVFSGASFSLFGISAPMVRATINANTVYYLVGEHNYTSTTGPGNGIITATRVG